MHTLDDIGFYITNVCNLACKGCESFNNFNFKGHQLWKDYEETYIKWSKVLNFRTCNIHGGEPLLNKDILNWADGLRRLWPDCEEYYVSCNGTSLRANKDTAYTLLQKGWSIDVCLHDPAHREPTEKIIEEIIKDYDWFLFTEDCDEDNHNRVEYTSNGDVLFSIEEHYNFGPGSIAEIIDGVMHYNRNDRLVEHEACVGDNDEQCHGFNHGMLYKCPFMASAPDFMSQFNIEPQAKELALSYQPGLVDENLDEFIANIKNPLKQCTLCNYSAKWKPVHPMPKKPKI